MTGYATIEERDQHESTHKLRLRCAYSDCQYPFEFTNPTALKRHIRDNHSEPSSMSIPANVRRDRERTPLSINPKSHTSAFTYEPASPASTSFQQQLSVDQLNHNLATLKLQRLPPVYKTEGTDWIVGYNPLHSRTFDIDLFHEWRHYDLVYPATLSFDGKLCVIGGNQILRVSDTNNDPPELFQIFENSKRVGLFLTVRFSPDARWVAAGLDDGTIKVRYITRTVGV